MTVILSSTRKWFWMRPWVVAMNIRLIHHRAKVMHACQQCRSALLLLHWGAEASFLTVLQSRPVSVRHYLCVELQTCVFSVCARCRTCWTCWRRPDAALPPPDPQLRRNRRHTSAGLQPTRHGTACTWPCRWAKHAFVTLWNENCWRCARSAFSCWCGTNVLLRTIIPHAL